MSEHAHSHVHAPVPTSASDRRWLWAAFGLIAGFMVVEVVVGLVSGSLALLSDAAHMLTDAAALGLALTASRLAMRPSTTRYTFGLKRAEILSAQANGAVLLVLSAWLTYEAITRLVVPEDVQGGYVVVTAIIGMAVNVAAVAAMRRADRTSLNMKGAYQHLVTDLYASIAALVAGVVILLTGFTRADGIATLVVVVLMVRAGFGLVRDSSRVLLEAAPVGIDSEVVGAHVAGIPGVREVHDLHVWELTSGYAALSAHVLVYAADDPAQVRQQIEGLLRSEFGLDHTTLQVDCEGPSPGTTAHCVDAHGTTYRPAP